MLIVTHGMTIMTLLHELGYQQLTQPLDNASVTRIRYNDAGEFVIEAINDLSYIARRSP
ncbi:histidine phosphatase family protein [Erwinia sp.]|uniref:histidine phosphatase family protein n=1 Tax=Erwinia citreus TaxID=558 RepID=UPI00289CBE04|nr:histidine phosphatase family protein [Erwinia sp.]